MAPLGRIVNTIPSHDFVLRRVVDRATSDHPAGNADDLAATLRPMYPAGRRLRAPAERRAPRTSTSIATAATSRPVPASGGRRRTSCVTCRSTSGRLSRCPGRGPGSCTPRRRPHRAALPRVRPARGATVAAAMFEVVSAPRATSGPRRSSYGRTGPRSRSIPGAAAATARSRSVTAPSTMIPCRAGLDCRPPATARGHLRSRSPRGSGRPRRGCSPR